MYETHVKIFWKSKITYVHVTPPWLCHSSFYLLTKCVCRSVQDSFQGTFCGSPPAILVVHAVSNPLQQFTITYLSVNHHRSSAFQVSSTKKTLGKSLQTSTTHCYLPISVFLGIHSFSPFELHLLDSKPTLLSRNSATSQLYSPSLKITYHHVILHFYIYYFDTMRSIISISCAINHSKNFGLLEPMSMLYIKHNYWACWLDTQASATLPIQRPNLKTLLQLWLWTPWYFENKANI